MAQVVEHILGKDEVTSSNLVSSSKTKKHLLEASAFLFWKRSAPCGARRMKQPLAMKCACGTLRNEKCASLHIRVANAS